MQNSLVIGQSQFIESTYTQSMMQVFKVTNVRQTLPTHTKRDRTATSMLRTKLMTIAALLICASAALSQTFTNPILGGDHPDPTVVREGKDYYMTHSSFDYLPGLVVFHSQDLVNWEPIACALQANLGSVWSPDICKHKGKYYIYFTVSTKNSEFHTYVVTASSPYGPWSTPTDLNVGKWIDPCHVYDEKTGKRWLFMSGGHRIQLADDGLSTIGSLEKIYDGWPIPKDWVVEGMALEGPKVKKIGKYYYYLNAEGGTAGPPTAHMAVVARAESVDGPWENCPDNPLLHTYSAKEQWWSKGHASLIDTPDGKWWTIYHAYDKDRLNRGRQMLLEPVELTADGWLKAPTGADADKPLSLPILNKVKGKNNGYDFSGQLSHFRIGKEWKGLLDYDASRFLTHGDTLTIEARGDNPATSSPLLFTAPDRDYEMSARFETEGAAEAGLILYYNKDFFGGYGCSAKAQNYWRRGKRRDKGGNRMGHVFWMKFVFEDNIAYGYLSRDGQVWSKMQWGLELSGYNHNTLSDFLSLLPGVYCYGEGSVRISNFCYKKR